MSKLRRDIDDLTDHQNEVDRFMGMLLEDAAVVKLRPNSYTGRWSRGDDGEFELWGTYRPALEWATAELARGPERVSPKLIDMPTAEEMQSHIRDLWQSCFPQAQVPELSERRAALRALPEPAQRATVQRSVEEFVRARTARRGRP